MVMDLPVHRDCMLDVLATQSHRREQDQAGQKPYDAFEQIVVSFCCWQSDRARHGIFPPLQRNS